MLRCRSCHFGCRCCHKMCRSTCMSVTGPVPCVFQMYCTFQMIRNHVNFHHHHTHSLSLSFVFYHFSMYFIVYPIMYPKLSTQVLLHSYRIPGIPFLRYPKAEKVKLSLGKEEKIKTLFCGESHTFVQTGKKAVLLF